MPVLWPLRWRRLINGQPLQISRVRLMVANRCGGGCRSPFDDALALELMDSRRPSAATSAKDRRRRRHMFVQRHPPASYTVKA